MSVLQLLFELSYASVFIGSEGNEDFSICSVDRCCDVRSKRISVNISYRSEFVGSTLVACLGRAIMWSQLYYQYRYPPCYRETQFIDCGGGMEDGVAEQKKVVLKMEKTYNPITFDFTDFYFY